MNVLSQDGHDIWANSNAYLGNASKAGFTYILTNMAKHNGRHCRSMKSNVAHCSDCIIVVDVETTLNYVKCIITVLN